MAEATRVLLDTSVLIAPTASITHHATLAAVSVISIAELAAGLHTPADPVERLRRQRRFERIQAEYVPVPYTSSAARLYGALNDVVRASGRNPRPRRFDLLIASVAGDLGVPVLTRNPDDFADIHEVVQVVAL